ncbi:MAG: AmmeMemoRadiSam system protein B [Deltaproteobacteria bacterium]|nr:AmmeMemoRadiSam system protein B [Deltaproteobacteria bacterium]
MSQLVRPAELAGRWYPRTASACAQFFEDVPHAGRIELPGPPKAAIVPHAGWVYSGAIAYETLRLMRDAHPDADLVVVFGGHLGRRDSPRLLVEGAFETPFGPMPVAQSLAQDVAMIVECDLESPDEFAEDNAIEVQMPMIRSLWPNAKALLIGVPPTPEAPKVGAEVRRLAKKSSKDVVYVGSTDLTHYGPNYDFVSHGRGRQGLEWVKSENDAEMVRAMVAMDPGEVLWSAERRHNACCPGAVAAAMSAARAEGATTGAVVAYATSYDVSPKESEPSSFVGYAGVLLG